MVGQLPNIATMIEQSALSAPDAITQLEQWVESYPACAAYRTLLAKAYKDSGRSQAMAKLELASLYAADREVLYEFMHYGAVNIPENVEVVPSAEITEQTTVEHIEEVADEIIDTLDTHEVSVEETTPEVKTGSKSGFVIEGEIEEAPEVKIDLNDVIKYDPTIDLKPIQKEETESLPLDLEYTPVYNPEVELAKLAEQAEEEETGDKDFLYWLNHVGDEEKEQEETSEVEQTTSSVDEVTDILERFLQNSKKRQHREKREFYKAEEKAKQSELDDSEVVSETLAKLYVKQELYDKALEAYSKLSLQNPEKSAYFAARIKEVEELKHSKED